MNGGSKVHTALERDVRRVKEHVGGRKARCGRDAAEHEEFAADIHK